MDISQLADFLAIQDLTTRYATHLSRGEADAVGALFADDGIYRAFGETYTRDDLPHLIRSAPTGQLIVNPPEVDVDGDTATGSQHYVFIAQQTHEMRLAWYTDEYRRTGDGWRFVSRSTTFLRRSGGYDAGRGHDPVRSSSG
jgi:hypothetical protein